MKTSSTSSQAHTCDTGMAWYRKPLWLGLGGIGLLASGQFERAARHWPYLLLLACPLMHLFMCRGRKQEKNSAVTTSVDGAER